MNKDKFKPAKIYCLQSDTLKVSLMDYGASIVNIECLNKDHQWQSVVLGFDSLEDYQSDNQKLYLGATIGRNANRIKDGKYFIDGVGYQGIINNGDNHLHGGLWGFNTKFFDSLQQDNQVIMKTTSKHGEEGYPGKLELCITYTLNDNELLVEYEAYSDQDTLCNITNHSYFNLDDSENIYDHMLSLKSHQFMLCDKQCMGTKLSEVDEVFDFNQPKRIASIIELAHPQLLNAHGLDHHFVLDKESNPVRLYSANSGIELVINTTQNGVQCYTANYFNQEVGRNQMIYSKGKGIAIEPQALPNAINIDGSTLLKANQRYYQKTSYRFGCIK